MSYKVQFTDTKTGKGFITGYKTARTAKADVARTMGNPINKGGSVMQAKYLGRDKWDEAA